MESSRPVVGSSRSPSFKKVSVRRIELTTEEIAERVDNLSKKGTKFLKCIVDEGYELIKEFTKDSDERKDLVNFLIYFSIISTIAHIIIQGGIMSKYVYKNIFGLMTGFLCVICVFAFFNFCLISPFSSLLGKPSCLVDGLKRRLILYFISLSVYLGLFYEVASFLRKNDFGHFVASLIILFLCVNIHGIVVLPTGVLYLIYEIVRWCCKLILYLSIACCCNTKEVETDPTVYLYNPSRTDERTCTICYTDYKKLDKIRVCKTHLIHIFHENCISKWLSVNSTCPLCGPGLPANFY